MVWVAYDPLEGPISGCTECSPIRKPKSQQSSKTERHRSIPSVGTVLAAPTELPTVSHHLIPPSPSMASAGVSTYRDRTSEFRHLSDRLKKIGGGTITGVDQPRNEPETSKPSASVSHRSEFNKQASRIGLGIHETSQKIARLSKRKLSLFNPYAVWLPRKCGKKKQIIRIPNYRFFIVLHAVNFKPTLHELISINLASIKFNLLCKLQFWSFLIVFERSSLAYNVLISELYI